MHVLLLIFTSRLLQHNVMMVQRKIKAFPTDCPEPKTFPAALNSTHSLADNPFDYTCKSDCQNRKYLFLEDCAQHLFYVLVSPPAEPDLVAMFYRVCVWVCVCVCECVCESVSVCACLCVCVSVCV